MERFETLYPVDAREKEIKGLLTFVTRGQSCQLISVPGAGRSTVLRLLAYNGKIRSHHLGEKSANYLFVYINFAEMPGFETSELHKALFLAILSAIREQGENQEPWVSLGKEIYAIFKEALSLNDPLVLSEYLKKTVQQFRPSTHSTNSGQAGSGQAIIPIFLFDRFSEYAEKIPSDFFSHLRALRSASGGKLAVVFSTHRPLEDLLPLAHWQDFYEFFVGNHVWLAMYDKPATDFRITVLEKDYRKKLQPSMKEQLVQLTGGHGKLMKLSTQILLNNEKVVPIGEVVDFLLSHILIRGSLLEIWESLTREERQHQLPIPLLTEFIKQNLAETLAPKTIRIDDKTHEIYFGDESLEGLTAQEFRLLQYLIANPNRVIDREEVIGAVWTDTKTQEGVSDEALDQMVHRVRKKIEDEADNPKHLITVKGRGFRFLP